MGVVTSLIFLVHHDKFALAFLLHGSMNSYAFKYKKYFCYIVSRPGLANKSAHIRHY